MFVTLRLITLSPARIAEREALVEALRLAATCLPAITGCWMAPVSPTAVINAGDVIWRITTRTEAEALDLPLSDIWRDRIAPLLDDAHVNTIGYRIVNAQVRRRGAGIWRALIFRTFPQAEPQTLRALQEATLLLPRHVREIRSWALSPVAFTQGPKPFTHVWEQEFDRIEDLTGPYMTDPAHWGIADAYFDAEYPEYIVDPQLIQVVGAIDASIMVPVGPQSQEPAA